VKLLLGLASAVILRSESGGTYVRILLSQIRDSPKLEAPYFHPPGTGWPNYTPQALNSLFFPSYDSQGYGGGIRPRLHTGYEFVLICTAAYMV
jgi:hypothetical protein